MSAEEIYDELVKFYGERLANHETQPRIFAYQVECYKYFHKIGKYYQKSDKPVDLRRG